jgi:hypothetical protein
MLKFSMDLLGLRWNTRAYGLGFIRFVILIRSIVKPRSKKIEIDYRMLRKVNQLSISKQKSVLRDCRALFVVTNKDFATLPLAIKYLSRTTGIELHLIDVVTPEKFLEECKRILILNELPSCNILGENSVIDSSTLHTLREKSGDRFGWIYQQLLKVHFCSVSNEKFTLICDADTILLNSRSWTTHSASVLLPSTEFNPEYYSFLNRAFGLCQEPAYSFVSHHMLINNSKFRNFLNSKHISTISDLVRLVENNADFNNPSMISIDYELFAQFMFEQNRSEVQLEKWSNINLPASYFKLFGRSHLFRRFLTWNYQSVSFHSWS